METKPGVKQWGRAKRFNF